MFVTGCTAGWILPSIPCFLDVVHTHVRTTSLMRAWVLPLPGTLRDHGAMGGMSPLFTLDLVICYQEAAFGTGKNALQ